MLQYTSEEQRQIRTNNKGGSTNNVTRDIDQEEIWHVDVLISKTNMYELTMRKGQSKHYSLANGNVESDPQDNLFYKPS